jgi:DNA-binding MarR family transcriptional regulator
MNEQSFCMQPALRLHRLSFLLEKAADQALQRGAELTFSQCMILRSLRDNPSCSQQCLAKCRDLTQAAVSRQTEMLREKGLLLREENAKNRREHVLQLTQKGAKALERGMEIISATFEETFKALSGKETMCLQESVDKLLALMRAKRDDCGCTEEK